MEGKLAVGLSQASQTSPKKHRSGKVPTKSAKSEMSALSVAPEQQPRKVFTVFLDRDGVLDQDRWPGLLTPKQWNWLPGAKEALVKLNRPDVRTCLVTNQPWTHTGILTRRRLDAIHARMLEEVRQAGGRMDRVEAATWPFGRRRKPRPGMLEDAASALGGVDKSRAMMVGDKARDVEAARRFGIPAIRVGPHGDVPDLAAAVERILALL